MTTPIRALPLALAISLAMLALACTAPPALAQAKPRIEKAADLPRFTYKIDGKVDEIVRNAERFAPLAEAIRRDVESVLARHEIADKAAQRSLLTQLMLLDMIDGRYDEALVRAQALRALEEKPADKLLSSLRLRVMAQAAKAHGLGSEAYRSAVGELLAQELAALPFDVVGNNVRELKAGAELLGEGRLIGRLREVLQPIVDKSGELSSDFAPQLLSTRYTLLLALPLKQVFIDTFSSYLAGHRVVKADIWAARKAVVAPADVRGEVRIAVWDSGVDTALYGPQALRDARGTPLVVAFDRYSRPTGGELMAIPKALQSKLPQMMARTKGFSDLQSNIDSPEAAEVKQFLSALPPEQYKEAVEEIGLAGNYEHGTHVAGIALDDAPFARLAIARIEFDHRLKPDPCPSLALTRRGAASYGATVGYLRAHQVRVVNMSWGGDVSGVESQLEQCGIGKTPDERKKFARQLFDIDRRALTMAMAKAPEILFVTSAGNSNNDPTFNESIPSSIVLPNLLTVGAVDQAGDEAGFTSYGPTVKVHANGYQVESFLPGGTRVALSGTSMASPQVTNLAAKLLAVNPKLKPQDLIRLIVDTGERSADGRRHLMHPKKAVERAKGL
jgi:hypothetical protein